MLQAPPSTWCDGNPPPPLKDYMTKMEMRTVDGKKKLMPKLSGKVKYTAAQVRKLVLARRAACNMPCNASADRPVTCMQCPVTCARAAM